MPEKASQYTEGFVDEDFPDNVSFSDLCDCGHHRCHHKPIKQHDRGPFPSSHYMSTFQAVPHPKPRSSKRPPAAVRNPYPVPMSFLTNQRTDFINHGLVDRVCPVTNTQTYEPSKRPLDGITSYSQEFVPKQLKPIKRHTYQQNLSSSEPAIFDWMTTSKNHFKRWLPQPRLTFGELPNFTGSLLFPDKENVPLSTTRQSFTGAYMPPVVQVKAAPDSIKLEGNQVFDTTHMLTYRKLEGDHRSRPHISSDNMPLKRKGLFLGVTQTQQDFSGYTEKQSLPPKPVDPPLPTIDLKFDNKQSFTTENRATFQGHDVTKHPAPPSCKQGDNQYQLPAIKLETVTSQKRDYQPINMVAIEKARKKIYKTSLTTAADADVHFDGRTIHNEFFQNWRVHPRERYGDFHENKFSVQSKDPFIAQSVTTTSYGPPQPLEPIKITRPEQSPVFGGEKMNFKTEYQDEFQKKQMRLCRAQVYLMQQALKKKKMADEQRLSKADSMCSTASQVSHMMAANAETAA